MRHSGISVFNKIIILKHDIITIRYKKAEFSYNFSDVHDIMLTKMKVKKNILTFKISLIAISVLLILFYSIPYNAYIVPIYFLILLLLYFKSNRYEQVYYLKIILNDGSRSRLKINSKDRLDVIREITNYIDYRFKKSMQELFTDLQHNENVFSTKVS